MEPLRELLAVDERRTLEFFVTGLQDVCDGGVDRQELLYNASVLAHYALVSTQSTTDVPAPASLPRVFDQFVLDDTMPTTASCSRPPARSACCWRGSSRTRRAAATTSAGMPTWARRSSAAPPRTSARRGRRRCSTRCRATSSRGAAATRASGASCATRRICWISIVGAAFRRPRTRLKTGPHCRLVAEIDHQIDAATLDTARQRAVRGRLAFGEGALEPQDVGELVFELELADVVAPRRAGGT